MCTNCGDMKHNKHKGKAVKKAMEKHEGGMSIKNAGKSAKNWNTYMKQGEEDVRSGKKKGTLYEGGKQVFSNEK